MRITRIVSYWLFVNTKKETEIFYLCNQAVKPNENKMTDDENKVTCKNCLKIITK